MFGLFCHKYNIRAIVELENGEVYKVRIPIEARFVTENEIICAVKNECRKKLGSSVKKIIEFYDAS